MPSSMREWRPRSSALMTNRITWDSPLPFASSLSAGRLLRAELRHVRRQPHRPHRVLRVARVFVERAELANHLRDHRGAGEGRNPTRAREIIDAHLEDLEALLDRLHHQLGVDERALRTKLDRLQHSAVHHLEAEVDVLDAHAERGADQAV